jgi:thimet oligopeptidase
MWHDDVRLIEVFDKNNKQLGYLFLDLHPRPNKYTHAAHGNIVPGITLPDGSRLPVVSVVMANFPKPSKDKPALLMREDVRTFFHEFGHAVHSLLGATQMGSFAGTSVKTDFVEMPSQMLEEWLWDKDILKKISSHYKTGQPLPDGMIENILALKRYDAGNFIARQIMLAKYSLDLHKKGADKDPEKLWFALAEQLLPHLYAGPEYRAYASFGHLTGYGAKYYGYLWSKVFALDLFDTIKKQGLLNPEIGAKYVQEVISKGGSVDPNILLVNFLGRAPSQEAFLKDMGLDHNKIN